MEHPSIASLLDHARGAATSPALAAHLAACAACRGLAGVGDPFGARALVELIEVDPALYSQREPLRAAHSGMGRAFRAWDRRIGRAVVIKQIGEVPDVPVAALRARFEREARITARLQHPGIVAVLELGRWPDGEPFYAMPLVEGEPLDEAIARTTTAAQRLALLPRVAAAAEAVAYAHDRGVVHRDLKPANILLGRFGETVVIDWGLAAPLDEPGDLPLAPVDDDGLTRAGVGTAAYMPPEQAAGAPPDPRFDVYALGATLYHALAGTPPYGADLGAAVAASPAALAAVLAALGHDVRDPDAAQRAAVRAHWGELVPPVIVAWDGAPVRVPVRVPADVDAAWRLDLTTEGGAAAHADGMLFAAPARDHAWPEGRVHCVRELTIAIPDGALDSLDQLLCLAPRPDVPAPAFGSGGHTFGCELPDADRRALVAYLNAH